MAGVPAALVNRIREQGPLTVAEYMADALGHPDYGYYRGKDPLGRAGDFITAPEISQMFGELIGLWCAVVWQTMGMPNPVRLVELGPGRGTLMADALRAARAVPGFRRALRPHLVETSPLLRDRQRSALAAAAPELRPVWHDAVADLPDGPLLVVANEFFDALPIRQFERTADGWSERRVGLDPAGGGLCFVLSPPASRLPLLPAALAEAEVGAVVEVCPAGQGIAFALGERVARFGGAALVIDYGHLATAPGDTLQAVKGHAYHDVLADPGAADLTAHVDFAALGQAAAEAGGRLHGPVTQGAFLQALGLEARRDALLAKASPAQAADIAAAAARLTDGDQMGTLFKVLAIADPALGPLAGFAP